MVAVPLTTGKAGLVHAVGPGRQAREQRAATSPIPGVAFVGGTDGKLHALSTADGKIVWEYDTAHEFETVNKVPAHGGAIGSPGATIVNGMLFVGSGYAVTGSNSGNVLLAFSAE